ncbi:MAG TPA: extracellular solute-binding protein, partial [Alphaproteobacteria bacterium]|nr:extracellular solute-binding protein [Alphaproteobacteria bacterium]
MSKTLAQVCKRAIFGGAGFAAVLAFASPAFTEMAMPAAAPQPVHALAMHGDPKYPADFTHFEYANPDAPKGGALRLAASGTFDNLNPYILKGIAAPGSSLVFQTLLLNADDEAFTEYGLIAKSIEMPEDRGQVTFNLYPEARWHDGKPLTADDVVWTFNTLMEKGHPYFKAYYANVATAAAENKHRVTFKFNMTGNRELPLIMGQMPVLPKHYFEGKDFAATTLEPIVGSGPYKIKSVKDGSRITYDRVKDWWAKDLPVMKGQYNFDEIIYDLFRDETVLLQALFSGNYDFRNENIAKAWNEEYDSQRAVKEGWVIKEEIPHSLPAGMQGFAFNIRRDMFQDPQVRRALNYAFDFEWSNKKFAGGKYARTDSFFENSELAASGL